MAKKEYPWFPVYAAEMLADGRFQGWSLEERGAWITLLCYCWNDGSIPDGPTALARLLHVETGDMQRIWSVIHDRFLPVPGQKGRLTSPRLEEERDKAHQLSRKRANAGLAGASARWQEHRQPDSKRMRLPSVCHDDRNADRCPIQSQSQSPSQTASAALPEPPKSVPVHLQGQCPDLATALRRTPLAVEVGRAATLWGEADGIVRSAGVDAVLACWSSSAAKRGGEGAIPLAYLIHPMRDLARGRSGRGPQPVSQDYSKSLDDVAREIEEAARAKRQ